MATARFIHDGDAVDHTPAADITAGDVVVQGDLVGISKRDIPANTLGALHVTGVFDLPKATGTDTAIAVGTKLYWGTDIQAATDSDGSGTYKYLGKAIAAAADADATVRVRLEQ